MLFLFAVAGPLFATSVFVPGGLNPGDQYRLVFVTSTGDLATSTDISHYNDFVTATANAIPELAALGATWRAIGSTADVAAIDNIGTTTSAIFRLDGVMVALGTADLWDNSILATISIREDGTMLPIEEPNFGHIWTGTAANGTRAEHTLGTATPRSGYVTHTAGTWISYQYSGAGSALFPMYAISSELTVPEVPEPSTSLLMVVGVVLLLAYRRKTPFSASRR